MSFSAYLLQLIVLCTYSWGCFLSAPPPKSCCKTAKKNQSMCLQVMLHYTPVKQRIDFKILLITFKAFHGLARSYWICSHLVSPAQHLAPAWFQKGDQAFWALIPQTWNSVSQGLWLAHSIIHLNSSTCIGRPSWSKRVSAHTSTLLRDCYTGALLRGWCEGGEATLSAFFAQL